MKYLILLLMAATAFASYSPQTIVTDANTGATANVNASSELDVFLAADSNVCKETGGNLASILSALQGTVMVNVANFPSPTPTQTIVGNVTVLNQPSPIPTQTITGTVAITGSITASNPSVASVPSPVPSDATYIGGKDLSGNLQGLTLNSTSALRVDGSAVTQPISAPSASPVYVNVVNQPAPSPTVTVIVASPIPSQTVTVSNPYNGVIVNPASSPVPVSLIAPSPVPVSAPSANPVYVNVVNQPVPSPTVTVVIASPIPSQTVTVSNPYNGVITNSVASPVPVALASPLPSGSATIGSVNQAGAPWSFNLSNVGGSAISLGQKAAASAVPVVTQSDLAPATQNITTADSGSVTTSQANGQGFITGTPTAGSAASFSVSSLEAVEVQVTGVWTGTLQTEISFDGGTTWFTRGVKQAGSSYVGSSYTQPFEGGANLSGATNFRVRSVAVMAGTATVLLIASVNPGTIVISNPLTLRDATIQSNTNVIKAGSSTALASDNALVVTLSPNSSGPVSLGNSFSKTIKMSAGNLVTSTATSNQIIVTYTVTTGKTFYIEEADCGVILDSAAATQTQFGTCSLTINGAVVWSQYMKGPGACSFQQPLIYSEPIFAASTQVVQWVTTPASTGNFLWTANFGGYEK